MNKDHKSDDVKKFVRKHYGEIADGKRSGCCDPSCCSPASIIDLKAGYSKEELGNIPENAVLGLGCGNPTAIANIKAGETVLDLGSGGGIDCFLASKKVGKNGKVIGIDMTEKMIERARRNAQEGGYNNVEFRLGEIENMPVEDNSIDLIISNCVINLAPDKSKVFAEAFRVLKPGGRIMVSDLVTTEILPEDVRRSFEAWAECIAGAMVKNDYLNVIKAAGLTDITVEKEFGYMEDNMNKALKGKILSISVKAFKPQVQK